MRHVTVILATLLAVVVVVGADITSRVLRAENDQLRRMALDFGKRGMGLDRRSILDRMAADFGKRSQEEVPSAGPAGPMTVQDVVLLSLVNPRLIQHMAHLLDTNGDGLLSDSEFYGGSQ